MTTMKTASIRRCFGFHRAPR